MERHGESWLSSCSKVKTPQGNRSIFISAQVIGAVPSKTIRIHGGHGGDVDFSPTATKCKLSEVMTPLHILLFEHDFGSMWKARCIKDGDAGDAIIFYSASYVWKENRFANRGSGWTWHSITHRIPRYPKISQDIPRYPKGFMCLVDLNLIYWICLWLSMTFHSSRYHFEAPSDWPGYRHLIPGSAWSRAVSSRATAQRSTKTHPECIPNRSKSIQIVNCKSPNCFDHVEFARSRQRQARAFSNPHFGCCVTRALHCPCSSGHSYVYICSKLFHFLRFSLFAGFKWLWCTWHLVTIGFSMFFPSFFARYDHGQDVHAEECMCGA
jgi:hypothetical protein